MSASDKSITQLDQLAQSSIKFNDVFPISHEENNTSYKTYKVLYKHLISQISGDIYKAVSAAIEEDLALKDLARKEKISDNEIVDNKLTLTSSINGYGDLAKKNEAELRLSALSHKDKINLTATNIDFEGKLELSNINYNFKDLISTSYNDLNLKDLSHKDEIELRLSALSHKDSLNLADKTYLTGSLPFDRISNRPTMVPYILSAAKNSSLSQNVGGINLGFTQNDSKKQYPVSVNNNYQAYVEVPWQNNDTSSTYTFKGGINSFTVSSNVTTSSTVNIIPYIQDNITGSGNSNSLAIFSEKQKISAFDPFGNDTTKFLRNDGKWEKIPLATQQQNGLLTSTDKTKLDGLDNYGLPIASSTQLGGIKLGYVRNTAAKNYPVQLDINNKAFVNVNWEDTNTTYTAGNGLILKNNQFSLDLNAIKTSISNNSGSVLYTDDSRWSGYNGEYSTYSSHINQFFKCTQDSLVTLHIKRSSCGKSNDAIYLNCNKILEFNHSKDIEYVATFILKQGDTLQASGTSHSKHPTKIKYCSTSLISR